MGVEHAVIYAWLQTALPGANLTQAAFVQSRLRVKGCSRQTRTPNALLKAAGGTRAALEGATQDRSDEGVAREFQKVLALLLNLFYKKEGLQYHRIRTKILKILSTFLRTSQQLVLQVANSYYTTC